MRIFERVCRSVPHVKIYGASPRRAGTSCASGSAVFWRSSGVSILKCYTLPSQLRALLSKRGTHLNAQPDLTSRHSPLPLLLPRRISSAIILLLPRQVVMAREHPTSRPPSHSAHAITNATRTGLDCGARRHLIRSPIISQLTALH